MKSTTMYDSGSTPAQEGTFKVGQTQGAGTCLDVWATPDAVENAHDTGTPQLFAGPLNNNATPLAPAPTANR